MRTKWIRNSNQTDCFHRVPRCFCLFVAGMALAMGACSTQAVFMPGSGSEFGTIDDQQGNTFKIVEQADNTVRVEVEGVDGNFSFTIDADGRLTNVTAADGSQINFAYLANNQVRISGTGTFGGQQVPFDVTVDIDNLPGAKLINRQQSSGAPFLICVIIDSFCDALEDLIAQWLPLVLDDLINENLPLVLQGVGLEPFAYMTFPTDNVATNGLLRFAAQVFIDAKLKPVRDFCAHWTLLRLLGISVCDV